MTASPAEEAIRAIAAGATVGNLEGQHLEFMAPPCTPCPGAAPNG